jgi:hypothetical protein
MVLCKFDENYNIVNCIPLRCQHPNEIQKNWLPFVNDNKLYVIYRVSPFIINEIDLSTGDYKEIINKPLLNSEFPIVRGSSAPIPYNKGWLFMVHFVNYDSINEDTYYTRFIYMNKKFTPTKMSNTFYLDNAGYEYISGLLNMNNQFFFSYSTQDRVSKLGTISSVVLENQLIWSDL